MKIQDAVIRWVSIEDELPPIYNGDVLVVLKESKKITLAWYQPWTEYLWFSTTDHRKDVISHWAIIPKPPCH